MLTSERERLSLVFKLNTSVILGWRIFGVRFGNSPTDIVGAGFAINLPGAYLARNTADALGADAPGHCLRAAAARGAYPQSYGPAGHDGSGRGRPAEVRICCALGAWLDPFAGPWHASVMQASVLGPRSRRLLLLLRCRRAPASRRRQARRRRAVAPRGATQGRDGETACDRSPRRRRRSSRARRMRKAGCPEAAAGSPARTSRPRKPPPNPRRRLSSPHRPRRNPPRRPRQRSRQGSVTGLPLPRFASLRTDEVNLRRGPGTRYPIEWVYKRRDLPVEIEREFEVWRLIVDPDGIKGWVHQATLTGRRSFIVTGQRARAAPRSVRHLGRRSPGSSPA